MLPDLTDKIIKFEIVQVDQLLFSEYDYLIYLEETQNRLESIFRGVGYIVPLIINVRDFAEWGDDRGIEVVIWGQVIARIAARTGVERLPAEFVNLTKSEESKFLLEYKLNEEAVQDSDTLRELEKAAGIVDPMTEALQALSSAAPALLSMDEKTAQAFMTGEAPPDPKLVTCPECGYQWRLQRRRHRRVIPL